MVQAITAALLFLTDVFGLFDCILEGLIPGIGQVRIETNSLFIIYLCLMRQQVVTQGSSRYQHPYDEEQTSER